MAMTSTPTRRRIKTGTKARRTKALVRCGGAGGARTRDRQIMRKPTRLTSPLDDDLLTALPLASRDAPGLAAMSRNWPGRDGCSHNVLTRRYPVEVANLRRMTSRHGECPANRRGWPGTRHSGSACGDLSRVPPPLGPDPAALALHSSFVRGVVQGSVLQVRLIRQSEVVALGLMQPGVVVTGGVTSFRLGPASRP